MTKTFSKASPFVYFIKANQFKHNYLYSILCCLHSISNGFETTDLIADGILERRE